MKEGKRPDANESFRHCKRGGGPRKSVPAGGHQVGGLRGPPAPGGTASDLRSGWARATMGRRQGQRSGSGLVSILCGESIGAHAREQGRSRKRPPERRR